MQNEWWTVPEETLAVKHERTATADETQRALLDRPPFLTTLEAPMTSADDLLHRAEQRNVPLDGDLVRLAFEFAVSAHEGQTRLTGEPYVTHPIATAEKLIDLGLDQTTILAGLLHDIPEDTAWSSDALRKEFGDDIAYLVDGVTKIARLRYRGVSRYQENLRKMIIAMARDVRVIFIKFADRLHNLQTLGALPPHKRKRIAIESLEIYAPIANRLGMGELKGELEDAAFPFAYPKKYERLLARISEPLSERTKYLEVVRSLVERELKNDGIPIVFLDGRAKHLYSLQRKLENADDDLTRIHDLIALRIIVSNLNDCYAALGTLHRLWTPLKGTIKDYIAQPKPNGYQSLHTTLFCENGKIVEFQIRTLDMHQTAEFGIAAHWQYDEQKKRSVAVEQRLAWVNELLRRQQEIADGAQYLESLKLDVFRNQIFVFTPNGDVIQLPDEATPVDFAYAIHTDIGNRCAAARVNDRMVSLSTPLKSGDVCEILTDKKRRHANRDWLDFVKTAAARSRIKQSARKLHGGV